MKLKRFVSFGSDRQGAVAPLTAICMVLLLLGVALVIDLGHLYVVRAELQNAADAGADAGAQALFNLSGAGPSGPVPATVVCDQAHALACQTVMANKVNGRPLSIPDNDAQLGIWAPSPDTGQWQFTPAPCSDNINAVKVITRKNAEVNGPVILLFPRLLGMETVSLSAQAIALLGGVKGVGKGKGVLPLALGEAYIPPPGGKTLVTFSPSWGDAGGWHSFFDPSTSATDLKNLVDGTTPNPAVNFGDMINCTNGVDASVAVAMQNHFYNDLHGEWITILPVIRSDVNYVQQRQVIGFVAFQITAVSGPPDKTVTGYALSGYILPGTESGGADFGLRSPLPKLVQ